MIAKTAQEMFADSYIDTVGQAYSRESLIMLVHSYTRHKPGSRKKRFDDRAKFSEVPKYERMPIIQQYANFFDRMISESTEENVHGIKLGKSWLFSDSQSGIDERIKIEVEKKKIVHDQIIGVADNFYNGLIEEPDEILISGSASLSTNDPTKKNYRPFYYDIVNGRQWNYSDMDMILFKKGGFCDGFIQSAILHSKNVGSKYGIAIDLLLLSSENIAHYRENSESIFE